MCNNCVCHLIAAPCRCRASRVVSRQKAKPTCMHAQLHSGFGQVVRFRKIVIFFIYDSVDGVNMCVKIYLY
jgi:hypothetical protein